MLSSMKLGKRVRKLSFGIVVAFLVACGNQVSSPPILRPVTATPTSSLPSTPYIPYEYIAVPGDTCTSIATAFDVTVEDLVSLNNLPYTCPVSPNQRLLIPYSRTSPIRPSATPSPIPTLISRFSLAGYVMTFVRAGDLYFQDGDNAPVKLLHVGDGDAYTYLSDDHQKIIFYRNDNGENVLYSIDVNGIEGQIVTPQNWLDALELGTEKTILGFLPGAHQLLLMTYLCESYEFATPCAVRLFIADADTSEIKELADLDLAYQQNTPRGNIKVSPDGRMIAVGTMNGVDIFTPEGKFIRNDVLAYEPAISSKLFPSLFWLSDSSGLIVAVPDVLYNATYGDFIAHTVWHYSVEDDLEVQIPLEPPLIGLEFDISPDGRWAVYGGFSGSNPSLYLADLTNNHVQIFGDDLQPGFSWGPDSRHFVYGTALQNMSTIDAPSAVNEVCSLLEWIDADHFTCRRGEMLYMAEIDGEVVRLYDLGLGENVKKGSIVIQPK